MSNGEKLLLGAATVAGLIYYYETKKMNATMVTPPPVPSTPTPYTTGQQAAEANQAVQQFVTSAYGPPSPPTFSPTDNQVTPAPYLVAPQLGRSRKYRAYGL